MNRTLGLSVGVQEMLRIGWYGELIISLVQRRKRVHGERKNLIPLFQQLIQEAFILLGLRDADTEDHDAEPVYKRTGHVRVFSLWQRIPRKEEFTGRSKIEGRFALIFSTYSISSCD